MHFFKVNSWVWLWACMEEYNQLISFFIDLIVMSKVLRIKSLRQRKHLPAVVCSRFIVICFFARTQWCMRVRRQNRVKQNRKCKLFFKIIISQGYTLFTHVGFSEILLQTWNIKTLPMLCCIDFAYMHQILLPRTSPSSLADINTDFSFNVH